jgi:hypothetical protein
MLTSMSDKYGHANPSGGSVVVRPMLTCGNFWTFSLVAKPESEIRQQIGGNGGQVRHHSGSHYNSKSQLKSKWILFPRFHKKIEAYLLQGVGSIA